MPLSATADGVVVVTYVRSLQQRDPGQVYVGTHKFLLGQPQALGTVQILIGVLQLVFGISIAVWDPTMTSYSGIFVWGALIYQITGSLTVAAGKYLNSCLVKGALGMSVVSAIVSIPAIILHLLDSVLLIPSHSGNEPSYDFYSNRVTGFSIILFLFHFLMLAISITVAAFACKATCKCDEEQTMTYVRDPEEPLPHPPEIPSYEYVLPNPTAMFRRHDDVMTTNIHKSDEL